MISREEAVSLALASAEPDVTVSETDARELSNGWFFPWRSTDGELRIGSQGIIVNKQSGECFHIGSAFEVDRDLHAYQAGYTRHYFDIRITKVSDEALTLDLLQELPITVVEPEIAHGTTWRVPRRLARDELKRLLSNLPCTFENVRVYFSVEALELARADRCCEFELLEPKQTPD